MELDCLIALDAVAEHGTMAAAASALHLSPSAVSQQLARLQADVGHELFRRQGRGVRFSEAGEVLAAHARDILGRVHRARAEVDATAGQVRGHVVLGAFASAARGIVTAALTDLARHPELTVELREIEMDPGLPALVAGDLDVIVLNEWGPGTLTIPPGTRRAPLGRDLYDVILPASHPAAGSARVRLGTLGNDEWVAWTKDSICYRWLVATLQAEGFEPRIRHTAEEHATQIALVSAGFGNALLPRVGRAPLPDSLVAVGLEPPLTREIHAAWRADTGRRPAIRAVVDALTAATGAAVAGLGTASCEPTDLRRGDAGGRATRPPAGR